MHMALRDDDDDVREIDCATDRDDDDRDDDDVT